MIVRIQASGASFLGAGKYYLHDKLAETGATAEPSPDGLGRLLKPQTEERVWFTDTRNTLNTDPERALEEMWRTADDQAYLKMQAGVKRGGRACEEPVKTLSLSWHKDDNPTPEHMIASADAFLKHMGWEQHQAVFVGHNDTEHRHIHIILNRINPENGRTLDDYREQKRAQVWALSYEKQQDNVRCEERELRAAKREQRAPELEVGKAAANAAGQQIDVRQRSPTPANDHLPHNVIMISRPHEREFNEREQMREASDRDRRAELKAEQRAEREAFFKDGAKEFKALRHAVYDEVRKEHAPEWRQFYKDAEVAEKSGEAWSKSSVTRALYFAKQGQWERAEAAYADRDSVRDAVSEQIAHRKADLKAHQTEQLRERQHNACDVLRESRDVQYQELLLRQRYKRGVLGAGASPEITERTASETQTPANQNQISTPPAAPAPATTPNEFSTAAPSQIERGQAALMQDMFAAIDTTLPAENGAGFHTPEVPTDSAAAVSHQLTDLAAGAIGSAASYLADQLGELFAPTPPEVREAQAKAGAKREAEKPHVDDKSAVYDKIIDAAVRSIEADRMAGQDETYWKERDRDKGWERDQ